jgi:flagellin
MPQTINTNMVSLNAQRNMGTSQSALAVSMQRLSSGLRVNSAKDDAAGLAIAERMNAQVRGMNVAVRNANDGISLAQTAEGSLGKVGDMLQRMRELAVQSANGTNSEADRKSLDEEYQQLAAEATRTLSGTKFNGKAILAGAEDLKFQVGANTDAAIDQISVAAFNWSNPAAQVTSNPKFSQISQALNSDTTINTIQGTDGTAATTAIGTIDDALDAVNSQRATFGAMQNRFETVVSGLQIAAENQSASRSRIMDADYASETASLSRAQILQQAGNAMVAQANQLPQQVLSLLR